MAKASNESQQPLPADLVKTYWQNGTSKKDTLWQKFDNVNQTYGNHKVTNLTVCKLQFEIAQDMSAPVRAYYHLDNFYQNHRRYVNSFNPDQLLAKPVSTSTLENSNCAPLATEKVTDKDGKERIRQIYPCGLIANSLFNDTIRRPQRLGDTSEDIFYEWSEEGIAWSSDKDLYKNLTDPDYDLIIPPPNWRRQYPDERYSSKYPPPNLNTEEHFISWMRTAALPSFFKPWAFGNETLKAGTYSIEIVDSELPISWPPSISMLPSNTLI